MTDKTEIQHIAESKTLPILNPNFDAYRDWPFAHMLPTVNDFAIPLDHYRTGIGEDSNTWDFHHLCYIVVEKPSAYFPTFQLRTLTQSTSMPARKNCIDIIGTSDLEKLANKLLAIANTVRNVEQLHPDIFSPEFDDADTGEMGEEY